MPTVPLLSEVGFTVMVGHTGAMVKMREPAQEFASVAVMVKVRLEVLVGRPHHRVHGKAGQAGVGQPDQVSPASRASRYTSRASSTLPSRSSTRPRRR